MLTTAPPHARFLLLPGTGADGRMFPADWDRLPGEVIRVEWSACAGAATVPEAAERLIARYAIDAADTLVGVSLGGMVACEIARRRPVAALWLVGSATHPNQIARALRRIHPLIRAVPLRHIGRLVARSPYLAHRMFADADSQFIRAMILAIFRWEGAPHPLTPRPQIIHGRSDRVIPLRSGADHILPGGHMFMMDEAADCVDIILGSRRTSSLAGLTVSPCA